VSISVIADHAKTINPTLELVLRTHSEEESFQLRTIGTVFFGEEELAKGMVAHIFQRFNHTEKSSKHHVSQG
jgi:CPA2 family monovalent cation:H+ antiporter-2